MRSKKNLKSPSNLNLAGVFFVVLVLLILLSFFVRVFIVFRESKYDGNAPLNILVNAEKPSVYVLFPVDKKLSIITMQGIMDDQQIHEVLGLGIDAEINTKSGESDLAGSLFNNKSSDLNIFDRIRILFFIKSLNSESVREEVISLDDSQTRIDEKIGFLISDSKIEAEGRTVEVINASGEDGLGTKIARIITNMGGNVVLVSTSQNVSENSSVEADLEKGYTINRLSKTLGVEYKQKATDSIADIVVVIGKDKTEGI